jgi:hypothetical protein
MSFEEEESEPITDKTYSDLEYHTNPWLQDYVKIAMQINLRTVKKPGVIQIGDRKLEAICKNCRHWGMMILIDEHKKERERETDPAVRTCDKFKIGTLWQKVCDHFSPR